jgi:hypothetical protein
MPSAFSETNVRLESITRSPREDSVGLRATYWALLKSMQQEFLEELLEMQAVCSVLCCLHSAQHPEVRSKRFE